MPGFILMVTISGSSHYLGMVISYLEMVLRIIPNGVKSVPSNTDCSIEGEKPETKPVFGANTSDGDPA